MTANAAWTMDWKQIFYYFYLKITEQNGSQTKLKAKAALTRKIFLKKIPVSKSISIKLLDQNMRDPVVRQSRPVDNVYTQL